MDDTEYEQQYLCYKREMEKKYPTQKVEYNPIYHQTTHDTTIKICQRNFNRSFVVVGLFGKGNFFSKNPSYRLNDDSYPFNEKGEKYLLECKIIIGKVCIGKGDMKKPLKGFDTTTNNARNPDCFIIFNDYAAIPKYLIVLKRSSLFNQPHSREIFKFSKSTSLKLHWKPEKEGQLFFLYNIILYSKS